MRRAFQALKSPLWGGLGPLVQRDGNNGAGWKLGLKPKPFSTRNRRSEAKAAPRSQGLHQGQATTSERGQPRLTPTNVSGRHEPRERELRLGADRGRPQSIGCQDHRLMLGTNSDSRDWAIRGLCAWGMWERKMRRIDNQAATAWESHDSIQRVTGEKIVWSGRVTCVCFPRRRHDLAADRVPFFRYRLNKVAACRPPPSFPRPVRRPSPGVCLPSPTRFFAH